MTHFHSRFVKRLLLVALLLALPLAVMAQNPLGRLTGVVRDASDAVLPGATVTIHNDAQGTSQSEVTNQTGTFTFPQLPVGSYRVVIELAGFKTQTYTQVLINVGQEYALSAKLSIGELTETVQVTAGELLVKTTTPEVSATVQQKQVLDIPLANRDITNLIKLQPGVQGISDRAQTTINGGRPTWTQVTLDGINIQDNMIRTNALDFLPNRPTSDNVAEFSITTSVSGADSAGGATTVRMVTPAGSNTLRGSIYYFNRDNKFSANSFFNNSSGVEKPELKRHQYGARLGGPIVKNKLFFFANYEGFRQTTQQSQNITIPANSDFTSGVFRYVATDGAVRSVNVLNLVGLSADPKMASEFFSKIPAASNVNNFEVGNSTAARSLNTAGYRYNQTDKNNRDAYTFRLDYEMTLRHKFEGIFSYFKETDDRTDLDLISPEPLVYTSSDPKRYVLAWRWMPGSSIQNEIRVGANLSPTQFISDWDYSKVSALYSTQLSIINPIGGYSTSTGFMPQGRYTNTYLLSDSTNLAWGNHQIQAGGSWQRVRNNPYNYAGIYPTVTTGFSASAPASIQLSSSMFPGGISATDKANADTMLAWVAGIITSTQRSFYAKSATEGYVPGAAQDANFTSDNVAVYVQDNWRWKPNFTVRAGLKWEYYSPLKEDNNLGILPVFNSGQSLKDVMLSPNTTLAPVNGYYYNKDLNNFGPTIGFAWDVTSDGKTAVRGGYSLSYVNEESVTVGRTAGNGNAGLSTTRALSGLYQTVNSGIPTIDTPQFATSRTLADQMALSATSVLWGIDPELKSPHVHQVSVGIQRELPWSMAIEARYVGTFGRGIWQGKDYNQLNLSSEFLADFTRARSNGYLAQAAGLGFVPTYNASIGGSQPLTVLPTFGLLNDSTARTAIQTNAPAALVDRYLGQRVAGALAAFMPNSGIYAAQGITSGGFNNYNSLQFDLRRQFRNGIMAQVNYAWSDTKTDSGGSTQSRLEAFLDNNRPELSTGRSNFHVTHIINANAIVALPFGQGKRWLNQGGIVNTIFGNWQVSGILAVQSGSPLSIFSGRGTFNRVARSNCNASTGTGQTGCNTASSSLSVKEIKKLLGVYKTSNGNIYWIDPKVINSVTGIGTNADNLAQAADYSGQIFFNPGAGQVGNLPIMAFDGPWQQRLDMAISKRFKYQRYGFEFKGEAFNVLNNPSWYVSESTVADINSARFGRITGVNVSARIIQLSGRFEF